MTPRRKYDSLKPHQKHVIDEIVRFSLQSDNCPIAGLEDYEQNEYTIKHTAPEKLNEIARGIGFTSYDDGAKLPAKDKPTAKLVKETLQQLDTIVQRKQGRAQQ